MKRKKKMEKLLSLEETLQQLRISKATLYRYLKNGLLPSYKIGGKRRFKISDIERLVNASLEKKR